MKLAELSKSPCLSCAASIINDPMTAWNKLSAKLWLGIYRCLPRMEYHLWGPVESEGCSSRWQWRLHWRNHPRSRRGDPALSSELEANRNRRLELVCCCYWQRRRLDSASAIRCPLNELPSG
ncbi:hypothetical protein GW17_00023266 [Ensete ventricosum]|nr:hypothetical protein GW17_00023266 [Ensete ventricosum]